MNDAFIKSHRPLFDMLHTISDTLTIIQEIHDQRIIHKDISPNNILIDVNNKPWLIDFEISSVVDIRNPYLSNPEHLEGTA